MITRHFSYPRNLHKLKTIKEGKETIKIEDSLHHIMVFDDVIIAHVDENSKTFYASKFFDVDPINELLKDAGFPDKFDTILDF